MDIISSRANEWRQIAYSFHRVAHHVDRGNLPPSFEAGDLARLSTRVPLSGAEEGVCNFLCHIWNKDDHPFELSQVQRWDEEHLEAFGRWVTDSEEPCRYF